jgi:putative intracellular protease/amidase
MAHLKRILIVTTSCDRLDATHPTGLWFEEFALPYQAWRAQGFSVTVASPRGGPVPIDPRSELPLDDAAQNQAARAALRQSQKLSEMRAADFDALFVPGGHGAMCDLPDPLLPGNLVADFAAQDKVIAAVCHGPAALVGARLPDGTPLVRGRRLTAFTNAEEEATELEAVLPFLLETRLRAQGARFVSRPPWSEHIEQDGRLITGQNPQSSRRIAEAVTAALLD